MAFAALVTNNDYDAIAELIEASGRMDEALSAVLDVEGRGPTIATYDSEEHEASWPSLPALTASIDAIVCEEALRMSTGLRILLNQGPMTVEQILDVIQSQTKQVPTRSQMNNFLSKNPQFEEIGRVKKYSELSGDYQIVVWGHVNYQAPEEE